MSEDNRPNNELSGDDFVAEELATEAGHPEPESSSDPNTSGEGAFETDQTEVGQTEVGQTEAAQTEEALQQALVEIEAYVGSMGWDQPARLFALVPTEQVIAAEPQLAEQLVSRPGGLTSIEQDEFESGDDVVTALSSIQWPEAVQGCAIALERAFLPAAAEQEIPEGPEADEFVASHPDKQDIRVVVAAMRTGDSLGVARIKSTPNELLAGQGMVPGLEELLAFTLTQGKADE